MPASNIQYLNNSPIQFYKNPASANDKLNGFTTFELTAYDRAQENVCNFITPDFCQYASINDDYHFQFKASTIGSELIQGFFTPILSGTNTSVTTDELVDSGEDFAAQGVNANDLVVNTTTNESTFALAPIGTTTLDLNDDIFTATPENYEIYDIKVSGAWKYDYSDGYFYVDTPTNLSSVSFRGTVASGNWYKLQFTITNYVAGVLTIKLGDTTVGTIASNGTFTFYDECTGLNPDLNFVTDASFDGQLINIDLYQVNQLYRIEIRDLADNLIHTINHTESSDSLYIGNVTINSDWADSLPEGDYCGCYRFWIYDNTNAQLENLVQNGTFTGVSPWQYFNSNAGITITGGKLVFNTTSDTSNDGVIQPTANIQTNTTYTVVFTVSNYVQGSIFIGVGGVASAAYAGNGTNTVNITTTGTLSYPGVQILQSGANTTLNVDNITVYVAEEDLPIDGKSECMRVCDNDDCYTLIKWRNDNNSFGFYYGDTSKGFTAYYHQMRVLGRLRNQKINDLEFNPFKNSIGQMGFPYYNGQKVEELAISPMPEYMHNALAVGLSHRTVLIDGVPYTRTGGYTPDWGDESELAKVVVEVAKNNQQYLENRY